MKTLRSAFVVTKILTAETRWRCEGGSSFIATCIEAWVLKSYLHMKATTSMQIRKAKASFANAGGSRGVLDIVQCKLAAGQECPVSVKTDQDTSTSPRHLLDYAGTLPGAVRCPQHKSKTTAETGMFPVRCTGILRSKRTVTQPVSMSKPSTRQNCILYAVSLMARNKCGASHPTRSMTRPSKAALEATSHSLQAHDKLLSREQALYQGNSAGCPSCSTCKAS